jgi:hypothetical protein
MEKFIIFLSLGVCIEWQKLWNCKIKTPRFLARSEKINFFLAFLVFFILIAKLVQLNPMLKPPRSTVINSTLDDLDLFWYWIYLDVVLQKMTFLLPIFYQLALMFRLIFNYVFFSWIEFLKENKNQISSIQLLVNLSITILVKLYLRKNKIYLTFHLFHFVHGALLFQMIICVKCSLSILLQQQIDILWLKWSIMRFWIGTEKHHQNRLKHGRLANKEIALMFSWKWKFIPQNGDGSIQETLLRKWKDESRKRKFQQ